jgi:hypothetical protein
MSVPQFGIMTEFVVNYEPHLDISRTEYWTATSAQLPGWEGVGPTQEWLSNEAHKLLSFRRGSKPISELFDKGLVMLINKMVFFPLGLALALDCHDDIVVGWKLVASPDGTPMTYQGDLDEAALTAKAMATLSAAKHVGITL